MLKRGWVVVLLSAILLLAMSGPLSNARQAPGVERLNWIAGCWASDDGRERIDEVWLKAAGESMMGMSRTIAGGKTVFTEYAQIREHEGALAYVVSLGLSAKPVAFKLIKVSESEAVFENPQHDFPKRVIYRRESRDSLFARIEGAEKGINKAIDFSYKRQKCD
jgi:hypothetical protein